MMNKFDPSVEGLIDAGAEVVFNFGNPASGKTCFLMTLFQYFRVNDGKWNMGSNPIGNFNSIFRLIEFIQKAEEKKELPHATNVGEVHELDLLITPKAFNREKLFVFLDMSGEDMKSFLQKGMLETRNKKYLIEELNTNFLYFVPYDKTYKEDFFLPLLLDYINYEGQLDFNRFAIVISHWDKNTNNGNQYQKLSHFLKSKMPATWNKMDSLASSGLDVNAFKFSIGKIENNQLVGDLDLEYCERIAVWLYAKYFEKEEKRGFWQTFMSHYKSIS